MNTRETLQNKLGKASPEWFRDKAGRDMCAKCARHIKRTDGPAEARAFLDWITIAAAV